MSREGKVQDEPGSSYARSKVVLKETKGYSKMTQKPSLKDFSTGHIWDNFSNKINRKNNKS